MRASTEGDVHEPLAVEIDFEPVAAVLGEAAERGRHDDEIAGLERSATEAAASIDSLAWWATGLEAFHASSRPS